ncbi:MAG: lipopolysaccharide transport periplasmic protein LptA [Pseudomonadota bacterium]
MKLLRHSILLLASLLLVTPLTSVHALSTDRDQPAEIEADDIEFDFKKGIRTYLNNVLVVQGTLRLKADKVVAIYKNDDLDNATAWGSLARFKQRPDGKEDDVEGWAKKIVVNQKANTLTLVGKAALRQGADTARGHTIIYNMATDTLQVKGGARVGAAGKDGQTKPKRTLKDPFADDAQGPSLPTAANAKKKKKKKKGKKDKNDKEDNNAESEELDEEEVASEDSSDEEVEEEVNEEAPTRSGRSRLIIQPK